MIILNFQPIFQRFVPQFLTSVKLFLSHFKFQTKWSAIFHILPEHCPFSRHLSCSFILGNFILCKQKRWLIKRESGRNKDLFIFLDDFSHFYFRDPFHNLIKRIPWNFFMGAKIWILNFLLWFLYNKISYKKLRTIHLKRKNKFNDNKMNFSIEFPVIVFSENKKPLPNNIKIF